MSPSTLPKLTRSASQRTIPLLVVLVVILTLGFYSVTDSGRLADNNVLDGADYVGYAVCHRITDRSLEIAGRQLPLCVRCTGMYLGVMLTFALLGLAGRQRWSNMPPLPVLLFLLGFIGLLAVDGINSYSHFYPTLPHLYQPRNWLRLITGMGAGLSMGVILFPALAQTLWRQQILKSAIANLRELAGLILLAGLVVLLVLSNQPVILYVLGLVSAAGVVLVLTAINTTLMLIITRKDSRADNWIQTVLPLLIAMTLALIEIGLVSYARFSLTGTLTGFPGL